MYLHERVWLFDCPFDNLSLEEAVVKTEELMRSGKPCRGVGVNVDHLIKMRSDFTFREVVTSSDLITVDGQLIVWASWLLRKPLKERLTSIDLMEGLLPVAQQRGYGIYFLGTREDIVRKAVEKYLETYPRLRVVGWRNGFWAPEEEKEVVEDIRAAKPDLLFLAMSSPQKEYFVHKYAETLKVPFSLGVGGAFDIAAGIIRRAPAWMRNMGLEWFWRFLQEPGRMWHRYFVDDLAFAKLLFIEFLRRKSQITRPKTLS